MMGTMNPAIVDGLQGVSSKGISDDGESKTASYRVLRCECLQ